MKPLAKPKAVFHDRVQERYLVELDDGSLMDWDHDDWCAVCWVVDGRTDTDWENLRGDKTYVFFYSHEDADLAIKAMRIYKKAIMDIVAMSVQADEKTS